MNWTRYSQSMGVAGIIAATLTLIALAWFGTLTAIHSQRAEAEARVAASVANQATIFQERLQVDFLEEEETLGLLAKVWEMDPDHFRLLPWRSYLVLLNEISPELFIADGNGIVRDGTVAEPIGTSVDQRDFFRGLAAQPPGTTRMFVSRSTRGALSHQWHINLARPLHHPDGTFAGVIVASLPIDAIGNFFQVANIGTRGMIAVVGLRHGQVRLAVGPKPTVPGTSVAGSPMFDAMQANPDSVWVGPTALDGVERVHGFRRVANRDIGVVVAIDRREALQATTSWEHAAYLFAAGITLLLLGMAAMLLLALRAARRREALLDHERAELAMANAELALAKSQADDKTTKLEATLAGMTDGVAMVDGDLHLVEWNERFPKVAGVPSHILHPGMPMEAILRAQAEAGQFGPVDIEAEVVRRMQDLRAGSYSGVVERTRPDGTVLELRRNRLPDGGFVTLYSDITARRESVNALREANALAEAAKNAMSRFVAIVSHEIRTPLNALLNSLNLMADAGMVGTQRVLLDVARQAGDALLALINDILEMSRMEAGQLVLRPSVFALRPLIESATEMFSAQAAERRIALRVSIGPGVPDDLLEDPGRVRQVLINLLSNAVKFGTPGEVRVTAEVQTVAGKNWLRLCVRDRGPVIPEDQRNRLFEPFFRLEDASDAGPLGTGLGLAICRHLVTLMGGDIGCMVWTLGGRDAGNEFWLTLPIKPPAAATGARPSRPDARLTRPLPRTRVLLVEDILANQLVTATLLRREGHLVDVANSGPEAMRFVANRPYDLVLMDIFMPGMGGLEATRRIRAMRGPAAKAPIVALTANISSEDHAACLAAGMNGMLGKPVAMAELLNAIARYVWPHRANNPSVGASVRVEQGRTSTILSSARLNDLRAALPADRLAGLVEACLTDLAERFTALRQALEQQERGDVRAIAHAMAGMAAEYGMAALEMRLRGLMQLAAEADHVPADLAPEVEADMTRAAAALREAFHIEMA